MLQLFRLTLLAFCLLLSAGIYAQNLYLNKLYDYDSTDDWGINAFIQNDANHFFIGTAFKYGVGRRRIAVKRIAPDGTELLSKIVLSSNTYSYVIGLFGSAKRLSNDDYLVPVTRERFGPTHQQDTVAAGLIRMDKDGNLIWEKYFTDTILCREIAWNCNEMPDGSLLFVTERDYYEGPLAKRKAALRRTDSNGNLLWEKEHSQCNSFVTVEYDNGTILVGGRKNEFIPYNFQYDYFRLRPWFLRYDLAGNLIEDTLYSIKFGGEGSFANGNITRDANGGYLHYGTLDSIIDPSFDNHPNYVAHLNDQFEITWMKQLDMVPFQKHVVYAMQLKSKSYLYLGIVRDRVFASKLNKNGLTEWDNTYYVDTTFPSYLVTAAERPDGAIVMTGVARSGANPSWRRFDAWVVVVDSNGCLIPNCAPTAVASIESSGEEISIYPNPATNSFTFQTEYSGSLTINNTYGQLIQRVSLSKGRNNLYLPASAAPGVYILSFKTTGGRTIVKRLVYQKQ